MAIAIAASILAACWLAWLIYEFVNAPLIKDDEDWIDPAYQDALKEVSDEK